MKVRQFKKILYGFTLVEILVVLGLFSAISTLGLGSLFNAQAINKRLQETQSILDNINLSSQTITREIRFGSNFYATTSLPANGTPAPITRRNCLYSLGIPCTVLFFTPADAVNSRDRVAYYVATGTLYKTTYPWGGASSTEQMTADDVTIRSLFFYLQGAQTSDGSNDDFGASDYEQPFITYLLFGTTRPMTISATSTRFNFETGITPRDLDAR